MTIKLQIKLLMKNEVKRIPIKHLDFVVHAWTIRCNLRFYFPLLFLQIFLFWLSIFFWFFFCFEAWMGITTFLRIYQKRSSAIITSCSTPWIWGLFPPEPPADRSWRALAHVRHPQSTRFSFTKSAAVVCLVRTKTKVRVQLSGSLSLRQTAHIIYLEFFSE